MCVYVRVCVCIYIYMCVCVSVCGGGVGVPEERAQSWTQIRVKELGKTNWFFLEVIMFTRATYISILYITSNCYRVARTPK